MKVLHAARALIAITALTAVPIIGLTTPGYADTTCTGDTCVVNPGVQTPAGTVFVSASLNNAVTVQLAPSASNTFVLGVPFQIPPLPPLIPGYTRTTIATAAAGTVFIDTIMVPPGPPGLPSLPAIVIVSIHPPSPCRARTVGTTVTFTPVSPPT